MDVDSVVAKLFTKRLDSRCSYAREELAFVKAEKALYCNIFCYRTYTPLPYVECVRVAEKKDRVSSAEVVEDYHLFDFYLLY